MLKYTVYRLGLFLILFLVLMFLLDPIWAAVVAALISMVASYFVLAGPREEAARNIEVSMQRSRARRAEKLQDERTDEEAEDEESG